MNDTIELDDGMENKEKIIEELKLLNSELIQENENLLYNIEEVENSKLVTYEELVEQKRLVEELTKEIEEYQKVIDDLEKSTDYIYDTEGRQIRIVGYSNGFVKYMREQEEYPTYLTHTIIGYNQGFYDGKKNEVLDFSRNRAPTIKFKVFGSMYNFKISTIIWDTNYKDYVEDQIICEMNEVRNQDIMFDSVLAEGMPNELLTWTDEDGNEFSLLIGDDNLYGFSGSIIICDLYDR